jgi:hypothetical protein
MPPSRRRSDQRGTLTSNELGTALITSGVQNLSPTP